METTPTEMKKSYVNSQKFSSTTEVMAAMKEMFKEVLQQVMEGELDEELDYEKSGRMSENNENEMLKNYKMVILKRRLRHNLGK